LVPSFLSFNPFSFNSTSLALASGATAAAFFLVFLAALLFISPSVPGPSVFFNGAS